MTMINYSEFDPETLPCFPPELPVAAIEQLSWLKLIEKDEEEINRLLEACKTQGFFYLNLCDDPSGEYLYSAALRSIQTADDVFNLPIEEKRIYEQGYNGTVHGYKAAGTQKTDAQGTLDTVEYLNISKDFAVNSRQNPNENHPHIVTKKPALEPFVTKLHQTGVYILTLLGTKLGLPESEMADRHRLNETSWSQLRLTRSPPVDKQRDLAQQIALYAHTDMSSITILFNWLGGLQIWEPDHPDGSKIWSPAWGSEQGRWLYVKPRLGCAIVNLGDVMTKYSNGVLNSGKHRVLPAPGEQGDYFRHSVAYFVRPGNSTTLKVLRANGIPTWEGEKELEKTMFEHFNDFVKARLPKHLFELFAIVVEKEVSSYTKK